MTRNLAATMAAMLVLLFVLPASAQLVGTPGNAPLTPGGPRQGLGPPSLGDQVPDIRLRSDQGGIPGAGPPIGSGFSDRGLHDPRPPAAGLYRKTRATGRHCRTPARQCSLARPATLGQACSCRVSGGRMRGSVVR